MFSLARIYESLIEIKTQEEDFIDNHLYNVKIIGTNEYTQSIKKYYYLDLIFYHVFIHIILSLLLENTQQRSDKPKIKLLSKELDLIDWDFIYFLLNLKTTRFSDEYFYLNAKDFYFKVRNTSITTLKTYLKEINFQILENEDFYAKLIEIQHSQIMVETNKGLIILPNEIDKRIKGKYYTPKKMTDFISNLVLKLFNDSNQIINVLDPACGSGLFLNSLSNTLLTNNTLFNNKKLILEGKDIDYKSLLTASLSVAFQFLYNDIDINNYSIKLVNEDYLLNQESRNERYDLILGNPPYIRERFFNKIYRKKLQKFRTYRGKSDLYFAFIEKTLSSLKPDGYLVFLIPRYWIESNFGSTLRDLIKNYFTIKLLIDFRDFKIFKNGVHSSLLIARKSTNNNEINKFTAFNVNVSNKGYYLQDILAKIQYLIDKNVDSSSGEIVTKIALNHTDFTRTWVMQPQLVNRLIEKINGESGIPLKDITEIKEGINTGADKVAHHHVAINPKYAERIGEGIFVLKDSELQKICLNSIEKEKYVKKWIKGKNISKWIVHSQELWLLYFTKDDNLSKAILNHLLNYKEILENRAEIRRNTARNWFELAWPRKKEIFETTPKLLIRYKSKEPIVALDNLGYYTSADFRILLIKRPFNAYVVLALLNSNVIKWILSNHTKKLGVIQDFYSYTLESLRLRYPDHETEIKISNKVDSLIKLFQSENGKNSSTNKKSVKEVEKLEKELNQIIYSLYKLNIDEIQVIEGT